jgi:hypothetical protein
MGESDHAPFDPSDPFDIMADRFRREVAGLASTALRTTIYRDLSPTKQIECFLSGVMTGMVGVCFASIQDDGRDAMMDYVADCLPAARQLAEGILADPGPVGGPGHE